MGLHLLPLGKRKITKEAVAEAVRLARARAAGSCRTFGGRRCCSGVNVLDENVTRDQADLLQQWGIRFRSISRDLGCQGMHDDNIVPFLLRLKQPTLLTRDGDSSSAGWFTLDTVWLGSTWMQARRHFLLGAFSLIHDSGLLPERLGKVIHIAPRGVDYWAKSKDRPTCVLWP